MDNTRYQDEEGKSKKEFGKKKDGKKDKKDKGYFMFEEENSEEEVLVSKETKSALKMKKHSKPSFKFAKKPKEKEKDKDEKKKDDKEKKKEEKLKSKKKKLAGLGSRHSLPDTEECPVFGVSLTLALQRSRCHDGLPLPTVFRECVDYIEEYGLTCEGIYRISGVKSKVQALKEAYNKGIPVYLKEYEPSVVASLLKQFLRDLPEPILTTELMPKFEQASTIKNIKQKVEEFQSLIERLPTANRTLLSWTIIHMIHVIAGESQNKMSLQNVSIVLSPTMQISHRVLNVLFTYSKILFRDTVIKKYVPPLKPVMSRWSLDLPDSPTSLEEELRKQESLLDELHKELMKVKDTEKEEQLWEVQRVVTGLKRKLKLMKKSEEGTTGRSPKFSKVLSGSLESKRRQKMEANKAVNGNQDGGKQQKELSTDSRPSPKPTDDKLKNVTSPSKATLDFGDIEVDSSAKSQRQQRKDSHSTVTMAITESKATVTTAITDSNSSVTTAITDSNSTVTTTITDSNTSVTMAITDSSSTATTETTNTHSTITAVITDESETVTEGQGDNELKEKQREGKSERRDSIVIDNKDREPAVDGKGDSVKGETMGNDADKSVTKDRGSVEGGEVVKTDTDVAESEPEDAATSQQEVEVVTETTGTEVTQTGPEETGSEKEVVEASGPTIKIQSETEESEDSDQEVSTVNKPQDDTDVDTDLQPKVIPPPSNSAIEAGNQEVASGKSAVAGCRGSGVPGGVEPEELAAALSELVSETEEDLNQRLMSEFVQDFGIERCESSDQDEEYLSLLQQQQALLLEEEELAAIGDELRQKIETEQSEIERLREEIMEIQVMREDIYSSDDNSSVDSSSDNDSLDGEDLEQLLADLVKENNTLETKNRDLCDKIHQERQICLEVKVQIRMVQQKQLESSVNNQLDLLL